MPITVDRGGVTADHWYESGIKATALVQSKELKIRFQLDSKGGGQTDVMVNIDRASFQKIIALMMECDFENAVNAFGKSLVAREGPLRE